MSQNLYEYVFQKNLEGQFSQTDSQNGHRHTASPLLDICQAESRTCGRIAFRPVGGTEAWLSRWLRPGRWAINYKQQVIHFPTFPKPGMRANLHQQTCASKLVGAHLHEHARMSALAKSQCTSVLARANSQEKTCMSATRCRERRGRCALCYFRCWRMSLRKLSRIDAVCANTEALSEGHT